MIARAVAAEFVKLITVRATRWLLIASIVFGLAIVPVIGWVTRKVEAGADDAIVLLLSPFAGLPGIPGLAVIISAVIGVLSVTTEIRFGTLRTTFLAVPNRVVAMTAKTAVVAAVCAAAFAVAELLAVLLFLAVGGGGPSFDPFGPGAWTYVSLPIAAALSAVLGIAVGSALRNAAGAITVLLAYLFVVDNVITTVPKTRPAGPYLPMSNLENMLGLKIYTEFPWSGWVSLIYLVVVIGALWAGAVALISRRDA